MTVIIAVVYSSVHIITFVCEYEFNSLTKINSLGIILVKIMIWFLLNGSTVRLNKYYLYLIVSQLKLSVLQSLHVGKYLAIYWNSIYIQINFDI